MTRQILSTPVALLCAAFLSISLVACSDDDASFTKEEAFLDAKKYSSVEELPACTDDLRGQVADVAGVYYACVPDSWMMLGEVVSGVCNIRACDAVLEGSNVFTITGRQVYTCRAGSWVDSRGKSFSDQDYINCFIGAMIQDTVASADSLTSCNTGREGALSVVMGGNLMACASKKWVDISDTVVSEKDLPKCSSNKKYVYVLSKVKAYECKDGVWYNGSAVVSSSSKTPGSSSSKVSSSSKESSSSKVSSSSKGNGSSSSKKPDSSSSISSSSKIVSSSSIDDGLTVRGICRPSVTTTEKGKTVTYSFYNLGGTPRTFNWIFGDVANPSQSNEVSPEVAFNHGGWHKAKLVVNEGMESQSDTVICSGVTVHGTPITGCECTTDAKFLVTSSPDYSKAEWIVTGCTGAEPFEYEWSNGGVGTDSVGIGSTSWIGEYAPYVTITNSDGEYMTPTCKTVGVAREMGFLCSLNGNVIDVIYQYGANNTLPAVDLSIVSGTYFSTEITMNATDKFDYYSAGEAYMYSRYTWYSGTTKVSYTLDDTLSPLLTYAVLFAGDTVCTLNRATCGPTDTSNVVLVGNEASWSLFVDGEPYSASSYEWKITDQDGVTESNLQSPTYTYSKKGTVSAALTVDKGEETETTLACADLTVAPSVTGCTCGNPTSGDIPNIEEEWDDYVMFDWKVTGCENEDELDYEWEVSGTRPDGSPVSKPEYGFSSYKTEASKSVYVPGTYTVKVTISNDYGAKQELTCGPAVVYGFSCQASAYYVNKGKNVTWSLSNADDYELETYLWTVTNTNGEVITTGTDASMETSFLVSGDVKASVVLNKGLDTEIAVSCPSVYVAKDPVGNCSCEGPTLLSSTNNVAEGSVVYQWRVTGCESPYSLPLTYDWSSGFTADPTDSSVVTKTFTMAGWATPSVVIENTDGNIDHPTCREATAYSATCGPNKSEITQGETVVWSYMFSYLPVDTYEWTITEGENEPEVISMIANPEMTPTATGVVNASVTFNKGDDEYEMVVNCSPLIVKDAPPGPPAIMGCSCGDPDPVPRQSAEDVFKFRWTVAGCTSAGAMPLTYTWSDDVTPDPDDPTVAIQVPEGPGTYGPTVTVVNTAGVSKEISCRQVNYSNNYSN